MTQPIAIGTILEVQSRHEGVSRYVAAEYNDEGYLKMVKEKNHAAFITIHPGHVKRIASNGKDSGITVLNTNNLSDVVVKATQTVVAAPTTSVAPRGNGGASKKDRALAIKAAHPNASRKELIQMFVEQLDMTPAGASTYASMKG